MQRRGFIRIVGRLYEVPEKFTPWIESKAKIESLKLPDGLLNIGAFAFNDCNVLKEVSIPDGVTRIGARAFSDCTALKSLTIPDSVTDFGDDVFSECKRLAIYGTRGSAAQAYAKKHKIDFRSQ